MTQGDCRGSASIADESALPDTPLAPVAVQGKVHV